MSRQTIINARAFLNDVLKLDIADEAPETVFPEMVKQALYSPKNNRLFYEFVASIGDARQGLLEACDTHASEEANRLKELMRQHDAMYHYARQFLESRRGVLPSMVVPEDAAGMYALFEEHLENTPSLQQCFCLESPEKSGVECFLFLFSFKEEVKTKVNQMRAVLSQAYRYLNPTSNGQGVASAEDLCSALTNDKKLNDFYLFVSKIEVPDHQTGIVSLLDEATRKRYDILSNAYGFIKKFLKAKNTPAQDLFSALEARITEEDTRIAEFYTALVEMPKKAKFESSDFAAISEAVLRCCPVAVREKYDLYVASQIASVGDPAAAAGRKSPDDAAHRLSDFLGYAEKWEQQLFEANVKKLDPALLSKTVDHSKDAMAVFFTWLLEQPIPAAIEVLRHCELTTQMAVRSFHGRRVINGLLAFNEIPQSDSLSQNASQGEKFKSKLAAESHRGLHNDVCVFLEAARDAYCEDVMRQYGITLTAEAKIAIVGAIDLVAQQVINVHEKVKSQIQKLEFPKHVQYDAGQGIVDEYLKSEDNASIKPVREVAPLLTRGGDRVSALGRQSSFYKVAVSGEVPKTDFHQLLLSIHNNWYEVFSTNAEERIRYNRHNIYQTHSESAMDKKQDDDGKTIHTLRPAYHQYFQLRLLTDLTLPFLIDGNCIAAFQWYARKDGNVPFFHKVLFDSQPFTFAPWVSKDSSALVAKREREISRIQGTAETKYPVDLIQQRKTVEAAINALDTGCVRWEDIALMAQWHLPALQYPLRGHDEGNPMLGYQLEGADIHALLLWLSASHASGDPTFSLEEKFYLATGADIEPQRLLDLLQPKQRRKASEEVTPKLKMRVLPLVTERLQHCLPNWLEHFKSKAIDVLCGIFHVNNNHYVPFFILPQGEKPRIYSVETLYHAVKQASVRSMADSLQRCMGDRPYEFVNLSNEFDIQLDQRHCGQLSVEVLRQVLAANLTDEPIVSLRFSDGSHDAIPALSFDWPRFGLYATNDHGRQANYRGVYYYSDDYVRKMLAVVSSVHGVLVCLEHFTIDSVSDFVDQSAADAIQALESKAEMRYVLSNGQPLRQRGASQKAKACKQDLFSLFRSAMPDVCLKEVVFAKELISDITRLLEQSAVNKTLFEKYIRLLGEASGRDVDSVRVVKDLAKTFAKGINTPNADQLQKQLLSILNKKLERFGLSNADWDIDRVFTLSVITDELLSDQDAYDLFRRITEITFATGQGDEVVLEKRAVASAVMQELHTSLVSVNDALGGAKAKTLKKKYNEAFHALSSYIVHHLPTSFRDADKGVEWETILQSQVEAISKTGDAGGEHVDGKALYDTCMKLRCDPGLGFQGQQTNHEVLLKRSLAINVACMVMKQLRPRREKHLEEAYQQYCGAIDAAPVMPPVDYFSDYVRQNRWRRVAVTEKNNFIQNEQINAFYNRRKDQLTPSSRMVASTEIDAQMSVLEGQNAGVGSASAAPGVSEVMRNKFELQDAAQSHTATLKTLAEALNAYPGYQNYANQGTGKSTGIVASMFSMFYTHQPQVHSLLRSLKPYLSYPTLGQEDMKKILNFLVLCYRDHTRSGVNKLGEILQPALCQLLQVKDRDVRRAVGYVAAPVSTPKSIVVVTTQSLSRDQYYKVIIDKWKKMYSDQEVAFTGLANSIC